MEYIKLQSVSCDVHIPYDSIMAGNNVLAAGLLMVICVQFGSSELVPDRVVYTDVKKSLVQGIPGVLTCRFYRDPLAVYWKKGSSPDDASLLLLRHEGEVSGPRYNDGSCDIDENYSLIIKNVSLIDAGRYYCVVSNYFAVLINNYTDVFVVDTAIETKLQVTLQMRPYLPDVVQCTVHIRPRTVSWIKKSTTSSSYETLVIFENNGTVVKRSGVGYDEGIYNITKEYSLVINDVQVHSEGIYTCNVTDFDTGIAFQDDTLVNVVAQPREPFPTIVECLHRESDLTYCSIPTETALTITCQVSEYYPDINLIFLYGSREVDILRTREQNNTDGTKNKTITIAAVGSKELYTCVVSNIPGTPLSRSTSALLHDREDFNKVLVAVLTCFAALILFSIMVYFIWRRKHRHSDSNYTQVGQVELHYSSDKGVKDLTQEEYQALQERVDDALMKHYRMIYVLIDTKSTLQNEKIIDENRTSLFDTEQMLKDWLQNPESTYRQYTKARQVAISPDDKSDYVWPFNEELIWISRHLDQESMKEICKKLMITYKPEDTSDERKRYNSLREWRNKVALENVKNKHNQLSSAIGSENLRGLLPPLKGRFIYKAELVDMAFNLLMSDLLPVAEALEINATKLVSYRQSFQPFHLGLGTVDLLLKLLKSVVVNWSKKLDKEGIRLYFYSRIGRLAYCNVIAGGLVAYDMSYGELYAISEAMTSTKGKADSQALPGNTSKAATQSEDGKTEKGAASNMPEDENREGIAFTSEKAGVSHGDTSKAATQSEEDKCEKGAADTDMENPESVALQSELVVSSNQMSEKAVEDNETKDQRIGIRVVKIPKELVDLQRVLQVTDQDIADGLGSSHQITTHALFRIWKEKPRPAVFNYRAALAHELRRIQKPGLAEDVIAGKFIGVQTSLEFIQNMVQEFTQDQLRSLGKILSLSEKDVQWHTSTPINAICQQIYEWVANWTKEMKGSWSIIKALSKVGKDIAELASLKSTTRKHKDLNDDLVENGFIDLAREIMIIEQQLGYVEHNFMHRIAKMKPKEMINLVRKSKSTE